MVEETERPAGKEEPTRTGRMGVNEADGGGSDNMEIPAKLSSRGSCRVDLQGIGVGEKSQTHGPQDTARQTSELFFSI